MRRSGTRQIVAGFVATGLLAFLVGFLYHVVVFASPSPVPSGLTQALGATPAQDEKNGPDVKPLEVFWETYTLVRQRYRLAEAPGWKDENLLYAGLDGLLRSLGDPYTRFLDPKAYRQMMEQNQGQFQGIGAYLQQSRDRRHILLAPIPNGPAAKAGLKRGDVLLKINGTNAVGMDIDRAKNLIRGPAMGAVQALPNTLLHPQYSCEDYLFIGGQVWDLQNSPVKNVTVRLTGEYGGEMVDEDVLTGSVTVYGESGYGFALPNKLVDGDLLYLQLLDPNGEPLSSPVVLNITSSCQENLILVNFKQVR